MSSATKNAAILLAYYKRVGLASSAVGITDPTFRRALRGKPVRWGTTTALSRAVAALTPREEISKRLTKAQTKLNRKHQTSMATFLPDIQWGMGSIVRKNTVTVEELLALRDQILDVAARLNGQSQAAA